MYAAAKTAASLSPSALVRVSKFTSHGLVKIFTKKSFWLSDLAGLPLADPPLPLMCFNRCWVAWTERLSARWSFAINLLSGHNIAKVSVGCKFYDQPNVNRWTSESNDYLIHRKPMLAPCLRNSSSLCKILVSISITSTTITNRKLILWFIAQWHLMKLIRPWPKHTAT